MRNHNPQSGRNYKGVFHFPHLDNPKMMPQVGESSSGSNESSENEGELDESSNAQRAALQQIQNRRKTQGDPNTHKAEILEKEQQKRDFPILFTVSITSAGAILSAALWIEGKCSGYIPLALIAFVATIVCNRLSKKYKRIYSYDFEHKVEFDNQWNDLSDKKQRKAIILAMKQHLPNVDPGFSFKYFIRSDIGKDFIEECVDGISKGYELANTPQPYEYICEHYVKNLYNIKMGHT